MFIRGLRTKIAFNIAILLFLAMLSIDLVMLVTAKRDLIRSEVSRANILLAQLEYALINNSSGDSGSPNLNAESVITTMMDASEITAALILGRNSEQIYFGQNPKFSSNDLLRFTEEAKRSGRKSVQFMGSIWGIFRSQKANLTISAPLVKSGDTIGGIGIVLPLENVYKTLRYSQQILFIYIFINIAILSFVGIYQISKLYLQPLSRLAKRAEDYREDDDIIFSVRKEDNELNRLSKALNSMLKRISADKEKLRSTVLSLEKANSELKKAQMEIIRAEKLASVGRLSAGIAHEIGNPIGIVIGYLELLKQTDITRAERSEYIRRTEEEIDRINIIIRQLLEVSRPSNSGRRAVSVHDIIHDTADVLRIQPLMSKINLTLHLTAEEDTVFADPNQLRQVFLNLIINAADAITSEDKKNCGGLKITTELEKNEEAGANASSKLKIMFVDDGPGIAEEYLGDIFDPFFSTKDPGKGTGLGPSVSFMIVESMGGRMTVNSAMGMGTTMILYLPLYGMEQLQ